MPTIDLTDNEANLIRAILQHVNFAVQDWEAASKAMGHKRPRTTKDDFGRLVKKVRLALGDAPRAGDRGLKRKASAATTATATTTTAAAAPEAEGVEEVAPPASKKVKGKGKAKATKKDSDPDA